MTEVRYVSFEDMLRNESPEVRAKRVRDNAAEIIAEGAEAGMSMDDIEPMIRVMAAIDQHVLDVGLRKTACLARAVAIALHEALLIETQLESMLTHMCEECAPRG